MTTPQSPDDLRRELESLDAQIAELQRNVDEMRLEVGDPADTAATLSAAEQQEALISQLDVKRRELLDRLDIA